ncbi:MAG: COQ9 family protein [Rickettsia endosymbiont of Ixodes persulcatus]|nr:COQ9 family protein [Rickettsia endosymbiont of Ixodes persulcatus]MCZ6903352.1 COQ9 family protein [Rickettsia endosymbiont of Ixodes persulcatus]MCZ6909060.1 COQ9 family protein [Rickettsia endosymbiont of Ixodes persulcatus]MCZ6910191.1 COQ9 family protein [Rickettsia endosymbiont of Ixodes persulcatus]MCZ6913468.1 COQ9 family protein [Rickettsia endosymbiont of Ixodes persulcatus]
MSIQEEHHIKKLSFVQSLLELLPFNEWNNKLLEAAEEKCGFAKGYSLMLFPEGLSKIVGFFESYLDNILLESLSIIEEPAKIREKISLAVKIRIKSVLPIIHGKNAAYFALNPIQGTQVAFRSCDAIWRYAGDKSLDFNYYTKRSLLLSVYVSSILFYIQDESENYIDTDKFIENSVENIVKTFSQIKKLLDPSNIPIVRMFT